MDAVFISKNDRLYRPPYARERNTTAYNNYVPYFICSVSSFQSKSNSVVVQSKSALVTLLLQATDEMVLRSRRFPCWEAYGTAAAGVRVRASLRLLKAAP